MSGSFFFDGWNDVWRTLVVGTFAYASLVAFLRVSGKRTLSKMNAFDLVVTVALGSTLASILLSKDVALVEGVAAIALLIGLQFMVAWASVRSSRFQSLVKAEPTLLLHRGEFLAAAMRRQRVTQEEIQAAVRSAQLGGLGDVEAVVLETDGSFSAILRGPAAPPSSLGNVELPHCDREKEPICPTDQSGV